MKLRCCFSSRQSHFVVGCAVFWLFSLNSASLAQDRLSTKDGKTQDVEILGVASSTVQIKVGTGSIGIPLSSITSVVMAVPSELIAANAASQAGDYAKAFPLAKAVAEKYKGLPTDWARQATSLVGDIQVAQGHFKEAEAAYKEYQRIYPGAGTIQTDVGMARIAVALKNYDEAKNKLQPIAAAALKKKTSTPACAPAYSQAFFLLGQIAEAQAQPEVALENYLLTVTLFHEDHGAVKAAQEKANALRKKDPTLTVP